MTHWWGIWYKEGGKAGVQDDARPLGDMVPNGRGLADKEVNYYETC